MEIGTPIRRVKITPMKAPGPLPPERAPKAPSYEPAKEPVKQ